MSGSLPPIPGGLATLVTACVAELMWRPKGAYVNPWKLYYIGSIRVSSEGFKGKLSERDKFRIYSQVRLVLAKKVC